MIRSILFSCCILSVLLVSGQNSVLLELGDFANRSCVADSSSTAMHPEFWIAYATVDDQLGSAKDSTICIDWSQTQITINGITGTSRPIFIEYIGEDKRLEANSTYSLEQYQGDPDDEINLVIAQYSIALMYESIGVTRQLLIDQIETNDAYLNASSTCVITEHMDDPLIDSYIVKVDSDELEQRYASVGFGYFPSNGFFQFSSVVIDVLEVRNSRTANSYIPANNSNFLPSLLGHRRTGIPSPTNIDTFFVRAGYDPSGPDTVTLNISSQNELMVQPFVDIAFENTTDPNINPPFEINYFVDFCLPYQSVERAIAPGDGIVFQGGQPIFGHETACIQLNESSYLEVGEQQRLWYGKNSKGMLAMKANAAVVLEPNSQVLFDGTLALGFAADQSARITIAAGAHLEFSETSVITHLRNLAPDGQIEVVLAGGTIDLSALTDEEREFFQISTQENVKSKGDSFLVVRHQSSSEKLVITSKRNINNLNINVYSIAGQLIYTKVISALQEEDTRSIVLPADSPVSLKAVQFITDKGEQQTLTLFF